MTHRITKPEEEYEFIVDAAHLFLDVKGMLADFEAKKRGVTTYYAVDNDVITLYLLPEKINKYAGIFRNEGKDTRTLLANLLADFIFFRSDASGEMSPCFIIPPHDEELWRTADAISRDILREVEEAIRSELNTLVEIARPSQEKMVDESSLNHLVRILCERAPHIVALVQGNTPAQRELQRLQTLLDSSPGIARIDSYLSPTKWAFPMLFPENSKADEDELNRLKGEWKERLLKHKAGKKPTYALDGDVEVMAMLEGINARLSSENKRLVLITGANDIYQAAKDYSIGKGDSFCERYIRHPRSFMAARGFFRKSGASSGGVDFEIVDWLNLFFPQVLKNLPGHQGEISAVVCNKIITHQDNDFKRAVVQINKLEHGPLDSYVDNLAKQVKETAVDRNLTKVHSEILENSSRIRKFLMDVAPIFDAHNFTVDDLRRSLYVYSLASLNNLYAGAAWIGLWGRLPSKPSQIKGVPELRFSRSRAMEICRSVVDRGCNLDAATIRKIYADLDELDNSHYLSHTVNALAFAAIGQWYAALTLCKLAVNIADSTPDIMANDFRKGREPAYLAAVAKRRLAESSADLDQATVFLDRAKSSDDDFPQEDVRFTSEVWAIQTARLCFTCYAPNKATGIVDADKFAVDIQACMKELRDVIEKSSQENTLQIKNWVLRQAFTNYFNCLLIAHWEKMSIVEPTEKEKEIYLQEFSRVCQGEGTKKHDQEDLALTMSHVAHLLWGKADNKHAFANQVVQAKFPVGNPFDKPREERIKQWAMGFLS